MKEILEFFIDASGGKINNGKSNIYGWNVSAILLQKIARVFEFVGLSNWNSFKYLRIPISNKRVKSVEWEKISQKLKDKVQSWGM